jgi:hypothetical protein
MFTNISDGGPNFGGIHVEASTSHGNTLRIVDDRDLKSTEGRTEEFDSLCQYVPMGEY